jgi:hypothetical protein
VYDGELAADRLPSEGVDLLLHLLAVLRDVLLPQVEDLKVVVHALRTHNDALCGNVF